MFTAIKTAVADNDLFVEFLQHEIDLLQKTAENKKPTKVQAENETYKADIVNALSDKGVTVSELIKTVPSLADFSNQKVTALIRQLVLEGKAVKETDGKKTVFKAVAVD